MYPTCWTSTRSREDDTQYISDYSQYTTARLSRVPSPPSFISHRLTLRSELAVPSRGCDALRVLVIKIKCPGLDSQEPHESAGTGWARPSLVVSTPLRSVLRSAALRSTFPAGASALKVPQGDCHHPLPYRKHSLDPLNTAPGRMIPNAAPCQLKL